MEKILFILLWLTPLISQGNEPKKDTLIFRQRELIELYRKQVDILKLVVEEKNEQLELKDQKIESFEAIINRMRKGNKREKMRVGVSSAGAGALTMIIINLLK